MRNSYEDLPDNLKPYCTHNPETNEIILWDETQSHEVCRSVYPFVIEAAINAYAASLEAEEV